MELSSLNEVTLIVLLQETDNFDEINKFFMYNYWNKSGIFVKLMRKVSLKWKNGRDFKAVHSTIARRKLESNVRFDVQMTRGLMAIF